LRPSPRREWLQRMIRTNGSPASGCCRRCIGHFIGRLWLAAAGVQVRRVVRGRLRLRRHRQSRGATTVNAALVPGSVVAGGAVGLGTTGSARQVIREPTEHSPQVAARLRFSGTGAPRAMNAARVSPSTYSIAMKGQPPSSPTSKIVMMLGWWRLPAVRASRTKRTRRLASSIPSLSR
jgi:hypothetical protein